MATKNYLELTNEVLIRLREPEASSVSDNAYVKLIAKYVNDSKRQVEDAYNWNALSETLSADIIVLLPPSTTSIIASIGFEPKSVFVAFSGVQPRLAPIRP